MSDPTDPRGVTGSHERGPRNNTRVGDAGSPVGSPLTIVLALVAVVAGFLIFRSISDGADAEGNVPGGDVTVPSTLPGGSTVPSTAAGVTTPTPTSAPMRTGATVVVINASEISGSAAGFTTELTDLGYDTVEGGVTDNDDDELATTVVYYASAGAPEVVARTLAAELGGVAVEVAPSPLPIQDGDSPGAASVFVFLGTDLAGKSLPLPVTPTVPSVPSTPTSQP